MNIESERTEGMRNGVNWNLTANCSDLLDQKPVDNYAESRHFDNIPGHSFGQRFPTIVKLAAKTGPVSDIAHSDFGFAAFPRRAFPC